MDNLEIIENLKHILPPTEAIIGYGSGIYKQTGYNENERPDKDVIIIVDNFKQFLLEDYTQNPNHFSKDFDIKTLQNKKDKINFYNNIGCLKFCQENINFKAMIISKKSLEEDLKTWKYFGMAGRLTKPILYQNIPESLEIAINKNRENILITALLFETKDILTKQELYNTISKLTYIYDFRTILPGEKKTKTVDIVNGAFNFFEEKYGQNQLIKVQNNNIINPHPIKLIHNLPENLNIYLNNHLKNIDLNNINEKDIEKLSQLLHTYFFKTNLPNSIKLAWSSSTTLGKKHTVKHALSKVKRHFQK